MKRIKLKQLSLWLASKIIPADLTVKQWFEILLKIIIGVLIIAFLMFLLAVSGEDNSAILQISP